MTIKKSIMNFVVTLGARGGRDKAPVVGVDPAGGADKSALTTMLGREVVAVEDVYAQVGQLKTREDYLQDALEHIAKTCHQSRSQTRRLRWIIRRVELVLAGRPYVAAEHSVPVNGISEYGKVKRLCDRYRHERNDYLAIINAVKSVFENDADVVGYIDALLTSNTVATPDAQTQLEQCAAMARMVQEREWADTFCTAPVSSRVESAFTQLHNELATANDKAAGLEKALAASQRKMKMLENLTGVYVQGDQEVNLSEYPVLRRILELSISERSREFKLQDNRNEYLRGHACGGCGGDTRPGNDGLNDCKCWLR